MRNTRNTARPAKKVLNPHIAMHTRVRHLRCVTPAACVTFEGILAVLPTFAGCSILALDFWFLPSHFHSSSVVLRVIEGAEQEHSEHEIATRVFPTIRDSSHQMTKFRLYSILSTTYDSKGTYITVQSPDLQLQNSSNPLKNRSVLWTPNLSRRTMHGCRQKWPRKGSNRD